MIKWTKRLYWLLMLFGLIILLLSGSSQNTVRSFGNVESDAQAAALFDEYAQAGELEHTSFTVPEDLQLGDNLAIFTSFCEIWVEKNGVPLYSETLSGGVYDRTTGQCWHLLPMFKEDGGARLDIYTRFTYPDFFRFVAREPVLRYGQLSELYRSSLISFAPAWLIGIALIMLGLVFMIFSQTVVRAARKAVPELDNSVMYLGLFSVLLGLFTGNQLRLTSLFISNSAHNSALSAVPLALMLPAFSFYMSELYKTRHNRKLRVICVANTAVSAASIVLQLFNILDLTQTLMVTHFAIVVSTVIAAGMAFSDVRSGRATRLMKGHLGPIILCFACAIADTGCYYIGTADNDMFGRIGFLILITYSGFTSLGNARELLVQGKESELYKRLATSDTLTGLPNRTAMVFRLTDLERGSRRRYGFFMMDLNDLKGCNDSLGHQAGDEYLRAGAGMIEQAFSGCGTAYRIGGDEFVVTIQKPKSEKLSECIKALEKLQRDYNSSGECRFPVGIAWGYAEYSRELDSSYDDTISRADRQMYEHKKGMKPADESAECGEHILQRIPDAK